MKTKLQLSTKKIYLLREIKVFLAKLRRGNKRIILVGGCFDILHYGHVKFLDQAGKQGDVLLVALESDHNVRKLKGANHPFHTQRQRAEILASLQPVDLIILLPPMSTDRDYFHLVQSIHPQIIATTSGDKYLAQKKKQAKKVGGRVIVVTPRIRDFSTSKLAKVLGLD